MKKRENTDTYYLDSETRTDKAIVRVYRPMLTEEERKKRYARINDAAVNLLRETERVKRQKERIGIAGKKLCEKSTVYNKEETRTSSEGGLKMADLYSQKIEVTIPRESELFRRIEKYAEQNYLQIEDVVNMITQLGMGALMEHNLRILETRK